MLPLKPVDLHWLYSATSDGSYRLWSYRASYNKVSINKSKAHIIHPEFMRYIGPTCVKFEKNDCNTVFVIWGACFKPMFNLNFNRYVHSQWTDQQSKYPSTGIIATIFSLHICDKVSLFGFGSDASGVWQHYFEYLDNIKISSKSHNINWEQRVLEALDRQGAISRYH